MADTPQRTALVTGGARGIGRAISEGLAADGAHVVVVDLRIADAREVVAAIEAAGGQGLALEADVTNSSAVATAVADALERFGQIDILVNCAGWDDLRSFLETDEDLWDRIIDINYKGVLRFTHLLLPGMIERKWGRIINIGSDAGRVGSSLESVYSGAKGAIIAFSKTIARESARAGVAVNTVCPGPTDTEFFRESFAEAENGDAVMAALTKSVPMRRLAKPQDIAAAVRFFASEGAGYVTGQTLSVSGGLTMV